jgi:hypothetical protein
MIHYSNYIYQLLFQPKTVEPLEQADLISQPSRSEARYLINEKNG